MEVYMFWGFLGSGKTTLITHLISTRFKGRKVVVIENESGKESVDTVILGSSGCRVVDLKAGCICCSLKTGILEVLNSFQYTSEVDVVLIEPSGLASLEELIKVLGSRLNGIISLWDVTISERLMKLNPVYYQRQLYLSSVLFLTKTSLRDEKELKAIVAWLKEINPDLKIVADYNRLSITEWEDVWFSVQKRPLGFLPVRADRPSIHINCKTVELYAPVDKEFFSSAFTGINTLFGNQVIRAKGLLPISDGNICKFDFVNGQSSLELIAASNYQGKFFVTYWWEDKVGGECEWLDSFLNAQTLNCSMDDLPFNNEELLQYMGFKSSIPTADMWEIIEKVKSEALQVCRPLLGYRFLSTGQEGRTFLTAGGQQFTPGYTISNALSGGDFFISLVGTVGQEMEDFIQYKRMQSDVMEAFIADALGSVIVEKAIAYGRIQLLGLLQRWGIKVSNSYSPGYCGWNVSEQRMFFALLPACFCGITLTDSCLMLPIKSVSTLLAAGKNIEEKPYGCAICNKKGCYKKKDVF